MTPRKNDTPTYVAKTPGLTCSRCGKDISGRASTTQYCFSCAKAVRRDQERYQKEYNTLLRCRDKVQQPHGNLCVVCGYPHLTGSYFCSFCGQRIRKEDSDGNQFRLESKYNLKR